MIIEPYDNCHHWNIQHLLHFPGKEFNFALMKKFLVAILALLYISSSTGANLHVHYCMGKLAGWDFGHHESATCGKCGMEKSADKQNNCCKDEHTFLKIQTDQNNTEPSFQAIVHPAAAMPVSFYALAIVPVITLKGHVSFSYTSPPCNGPAIYLRNCVFII